MTGLHMVQYRIDGELGRGGMGVVYVASDTKLNRKVALKVLPASSLASEEDRARFFREAQAAAQLSHPNVCHVYQVDETVPLGETGEPVVGHTDRRAFIAMEFIEGETLAARIAKSPLKLSEAVDIASQVAEALKAAHAKQIVHRDIKAANVMLTAEGVAKVLDFGLAKTNASTQLTRQGSTLGTIAYMSPEQARGQEVDGRSDLYSLGTMLYEMIAGRLPFAGDYEQAVVYGILNEPPEPLTTLRTGVPMQLEWLVNKLLSKEADYRYQTAADLLADLKSLDLTGSGNSRRSMSAVNADRLTSATPARPSRPVWVWPALAATLMAGFALAALTGVGLEALEDVSLPSVRSELFLGGGRVPQALSLSSDGSLLAYSTTGDGNVWIRDLETGDEREIPGASGIIEMDFSPDGQWLLLDQEYAVLRVPISGGSPVQLVTTFLNAPHSSWIDDQTILYDDRGSIHEYSLVTGSSRPIASADTSLGELRLIFGQVTPDHSRTLAILVSDPSEDRIAVYTYPGGKPVIKDGLGRTSFRYIPEGYLLTLVDQNLMARPFDLESAEFTGPSVRIAQGISETSWSLSKSGLLAWSPVTSFQFATSSRQSPEALLALWSQADSSAILGAPIDSYADLAVSPDGRRLAADIWSNNESYADVWIIDLDTGTRSQLTFDRTGSYPAWSPDGDSVAVVHRVSDTLFRVEVLAADGSGSRRIVYEDSLSLESLAWSKSARTIATARRAPAEGLEILFVDPYSGVARTGVPSGVRQTAPDFSPDGRYVAFERMNGVFVRTTAPDGGEWDVSQGGGNRPKWAPDGSALYYSSGGQVMRVAVDASGQFRRLGAAEALITTRLVSVHYSPMPASGTILFAQNPEYVSLDERVSVKLLTNATGAIKRLAPAVR